LQWKEKKVETKDMTRRREDRKDCWRTLQFYTARKDEVLLGKTVYLLTLICSGRRTKVEKKDMTRRR
jgi:hypothetical protein